MKRLALLIVVCAFFTVPPGAFAKNGKEDDRHHNSEGEREDGPNHHSRNGSKSGTSSTPAKARPKRLEARLSAIAGAALSGRGKIRIENKVKRNSVKSSLDASIYVSPASFADSPDASIKIQFLREGSVIAVCTTTFDEIEEEHGTVQAEYKLKINAVTDSAGTTFSNAKKGICDIDPVATDIQSGFPVLQTGDTVAVLGVTPGSAAQFLTGTMAAKK